MWHETTPEMLFQMTRQDQDRRLTEAGTRVRLRAERSPARSERQREVGFSGLQLRFGSLTLMVGRTVCSH